MYSRTRVQTDAANRIYDGNDNTELMGAGSNMSFTISGEYTTDKIDGLAEGIRVVFYDSTGADRAIFGVATLDTENGTVSGDQYKLKLKLVDYEINASGVMVTREFLEDDNGTTVDESVALTALTANEAMRMTALVYLDGDVIDNSDAGIAAALNGKLNLQFTSSATLTPMDNETLKNYSKE